MGLDTSHDCWHGSYSSFSQWRRYLGELARIQYKSFEMDLGFKYKYMEPDIDWSIYTKQNIKGKWKETPKDPIMILICHSDCEGSIKIEQLKPLKDRLEELLPLMDPLNEYFIGKTKSFIKGLEKAIQANEDVEFH
jgi:hypothetical protein